MLKQLLCITMSTAIVTTVAGGSINISAKESYTVNNYSEDINMNKDETPGMIDAEDYSITITEDSKTRTVVTYDKNTKETSTAIFDKATNKLHDEKGNYLGTGYVVASRGVYGPFRANFDINPASFGAIVGCILAIGIIVSTAGAAGVPLTALKAGVQKIFSYGGAGTLGERWAPDASINGYFEYKQEISGTRARNLNRKFCARIGRTDGYTSHSYGDGGWFDTVKPY